MREAARRTNRSPETIRRWIWSGRLPATKRGNTYYVDVLQLEGLAMEIGGAGHLTGAARRDLTRRDLTQGDLARGGAAAGDVLAGWLAEVGRWKSGLAAEKGREFSRTASDLVTEDRRARR